MSNLQAGDHVLTDRDIECVVTEVDFQTDRFTVETPAGLLLMFYDTDLEELPAPVDGGRDALEQWLRCVALIVPRLRHETDTVRCSTAECECRYCYVITTRSHRPDDFADVTTVKHFVDSEVCHCEASCPCQKDVR